MEFYGLMWNGLELGIRIEIEMVGPPPAVRVRVAGGPDGDGFDVLILRDELLDESTRWAKIADALGEAMAHVRGAPRPQQFVGHDPDLTVHFGGTEKPKHSTPPPPIE